MASVHFSSLTDTLVDGARRWWYIDSSNGSDRASGKSWSQAKKTLAGVTADSAFASGHGIVIDGALSERADLSAYTDLVLRGVGAASITFDGTGGRDSTLTVGDRIKIYNLAILNTCAARTTQEQTHVPALSIAEGSTDVLVDGCRVESNEQGIQAGGSAGGLRIQGTTIRASEYGVNCIGLVASGGSELVAIKDTQIYLSNWSLCGSDGIYAQADSENISSRHGFLSLRDSLIQVAQPNGASTVDEDAVGLHLLDISAVVDSVGFDITTMDAGRYAIGIRADSSDVACVHPTVISNSSVYVKAAGGASKKRVFDAGSNGALIRYAAVAACSSTVNGDVAVADTTLGMA